MAEDETLDVNKDAKSLPKGVESYNKDLLQLWTCGDSISSGYGRFLKQKIAGKISYVNQRQVEELFEGVKVPRYSGLLRDLTIHLKAILELDDKVYVPDVLLLNSGLHDAHRGYKHLKTNAEKVAAYRRQLEVVTNLAKEHKVRLIWVQTTPKETSDTQNVLLDLFNKTAKEVLEKNNFPIIELDIFTKSLIKKKGEAKVILPDGVHFTDEAKEAQGTYIGEQLLNLLKDDLKESNL